MAKVKLGEVQLDETGQDWRVYLTGKAPKKETKVTTGYWRVESNKLYATPVQTIFDEGMILVKFPFGAPFLEDKPTDIDPDCGDTWHKFVDEFWPKCKPVEYAEYMDAINPDKGGFWADTLATQPRDTLGANMSPEALADEMLKAARENLAKAEAMAKGGKAKNQKAADAAAILEKAMSTQRAALKEFHEAEKKPHLDAARAVDDRFLPLIKSMVNAGKDIDAKVKRPFLLEQEEIARRAREAAQKVLDDAAAEAAKNAPATPLDEGWDEAQPTAPRVEISTPKVSAGVRGARSSLRDVKYGVITDYKALACAMIDNLGLNPALRTVLDNYANSLARTAAGDGKAKGAVIFPGVELDIRRE